MEITNNTIINVCNYMPIKIIASTSTEDYIFEPCETNNPIIIPMTAVNVKEIHSKSKIFADGWLSFEDDVKDDMYKFLKIKDGDKILNHFEIIDCIVSGRKEDILKIINIKSKGYFERVYGIYVALKQSNRYDISMRIANAIEYRYKELQRNILNTQIELLDVFKSDEKDKKIEEQEILLKEREEKINDMDSAMSALEKQVKELEKALAKLAKQNETISESNEDVEKVASKTRKKESSAIKE